MPQKDKYHIIWLKSITLKILSYHKEREKIDIKRVTKQPENN